MRYLVILEKGPTSFGAFVPDLPGCAAVGETEAEVLELIHEAIDMHLEDLRERGSPVPLPTSRSTFVEVSANL